MVCGLFWALTAPVPDILVADDASTIAVRAADGRLYFPRPPKDTFAASRWLQRDGDARDFHQAVGIGRCDSIGCVIATPDGVIAMPSRPEALAEDCARAVLVISAVPATACAGPKLVLDANVIMRDGGYAITDAKPVSVRQWRGKRPWNP
jgi:competence protein ComEC